MPLFHIITSLRLTAFVHTGKMLACENSSKTSSLFSPLPKFVILEAVDL